MIRRLWEEYGFEAVLIGSWAGCVLAGLGIGLLWCGS